MNSVTWFLLATKLKKGEKDRLRGERLRKKKPGLHDLEHSQPNQTAKDVKVRRFIVRDVYSGLKVNNIPKNFLIVDRKD